MNHADLAARLDGAADRLTARVLGEMYADPFWHERFGARADRHGQKDGRFHIDYLIQALHAGDTGVIERYARWLQPVLTSRGMCTRHLAENFARLGDAIRDEIGGEAGPAIALLDAARAALTYPAGAARDLQLAAPALAAAAAAALYAGDPGRLARWGEAGRVRCLDELDELVSYAADAVSLGQPQVFTGHITWLGGFFERRQISRDHLADSLAALREVAPASLPVAAADALRGVLDPAITALGSLPAAGTRGD